MACRPIRAASGLSKDVSFPKPCSRKSRLFGNRWLPQTTCTDALDAQAVFCRRRHQPRWRIIFVEISHYRTRSKSQNRSRTFPSACEGFASSVIATIEPTPVHRRVPYTFADVPLNARRLVVSQIASTALQEHQRRSQERGFDDGEHARDPLFIGSRWLPLQQVRRCGRRHPPCPMPTEDGYDDPQKAGGTIVFGPAMLLCGDATQQVLLPKSRLRRRLRSIHRQRAKIQSRRSCLEARLRSPSS